MSLILQDNLRLEAREVIGGIDLYEDQIIHIGGLNNLKVRFLNFCVKEKIISPDEIKEMIHKRLLIIGRKNMEMSAKGAWADHVTSPYALAYALRNNEFTDREIRKINFDSMHGHTALNFMAGKVGDLVDKVMQDLLTEKDIKPTAPDPDEVVCVDGGPCTC